MFAAALLLAALPAPAQSDAARDYRAADAELNRTYKAVLAGRDRVFTAKMRAAQRAWIAFRDAHAESVYPAADKRLEYGSIYPECRLALLTELTRERIRQLQVWLSGREEGDVCAGSQTKP